MSQNGPRHSGGYKPNNAAAQSAARAALSGERLEAPDIRRIPRALIDPDELQPRTRFDPAAIQELRASIENDGQQQPIKVIPSGNRFRVVWGHRRYWATEGMELIDAIVQTDKLSQQKTLELQIAENIQREALSLADICRAIVRFQDDFKQTYSYLAKNIFAPLAKGEERWIGDRARAWRKADEETRRLMEDYGDVLTHVEVINGVESESLRKRMVKATRDGATVSALKAMIPAKVAPLKAPAPFSPQARQVEAPSIAAPLLTKPTREELNEAAAQLDWTPAPDVPQYTADSLNTALDTVRHFVAAAAKQVPIVACSSTYDATAQEAFRTQIRRLRESLDAMEAAL